MTAVVVFRGPTVTASQVRAALPGADLRCAPPAAQGDLYRAVRAGARHIGLIDGTFERGPAVWHKEILHALHAGVAVFGAASMGALRAVECAPFGARPVGRIAGWYADGTLTDDDEVTVAHLDGAHDWRCTSEAMVNIRATLEAAVGRGVLPQTVARTLCGMAKRTFYPERSWPRLLAEASDAGLAPAPLGAFADWLPAHRVDLKHRDALEMLRALAAALAGGASTAPAAPPGWRPEPSRVWLRARAAMAGHRSGADLDRLIDALRLDDAWYEVHQAAFLRHLAVAEARRHGVHPDPDAAAAQLREALGLATGEELATWCAANDLDTDGLRRLAADQARLTWAHRRHDDAVRAAVADQLRIRGWYADLVAGTAAGVGTDGTAADAGGTGDAAPTADASPVDGADASPADGAEGSAVWDWYAASRDLAGRGWPDPRHGPAALAALAAHLGFDAPGDLTLAVRRAWRAAHPVAR